MPSPIGSLRTERDPQFDLPDFPASPGASPSALPPPEPFVPGLDEGLRAFVEASRAQQKASELAQVGGIVASPADVDAERTAHLRAFFSRFAIEVPVLEGAQGETRKVTVPFRIALNDIEGHTARLREALGSASSIKNAGLVAAGRATVDQLTVVVNDLARLHPEEFGTRRTQEDVRNYLRTLGVGIDCAGSVQLALLDLHGLPPDAGPKMGLKPRLLEDLTGLGRQKAFFQEIGDPSALRPGDLIILKHPPNDAVGHTLIVTEKATGPLTESECTELARHFPALARPGDDVVRVSVASSFGWDGPQERTWIYNPLTTDWGDLGGQLFDDRSTPAPGRHSGPWDHPKGGMFRAR